MHHKRQDQKETHSLDEPISEYGILSEQKVALAVLTLQKYEKQRGHVSH